MRNEKPQRGRNREFWQLNCDIFGSAVLSSDLEILQLALDIMLEFDPPQDSFSLMISSRELIDGVLELAGAKNLSSENKLLVVRTLDKWQKLKGEDTKARLKDAGLDIKAVKVIETFMSSKNIETLAIALPALKNNSGLLKIVKIMDDLADLGYGDFIEFNPTVIRGFDYYDGIIFEVFDKNPENNRAMFGGGRYNGLAEIFGVTNFPAIGFAPGDETTRLFLESWGMIDKIIAEQPIKYYLPILDESLIKETAHLAKILRVRGFNIITGLEEQKIGKALEFANKKKTVKVIIFGSEENQKRIYKIKDMNGGGEEVVKL